MDKDFLRNFLIAAAVFMIVMYIGSRMPKPPQPAPTEQPTSRQTAQPPTTPEGTQPAPAEAPAAAVAEMPAAEPTTATTTTPAQPAAQPAGYTVVEAETIDVRPMGAAEVTEEPEKGAPEDPYRMRLLLTNLGAGIESAESADHRQDSDNPKRYSVLSSMDSVNVQTGVRTGHHASMVIEKINIDGSTDIRLDDKKWNLDIKEMEGGQEATFQIEIHQDGEPALRLTRTFMLPKQPRELGRCDLHSTLGVENLSGAEKQVILTFRGGLGITREAARLDDRYLDYGLIAEGQVNGHRKRNGDVSKLESNSLRLFVAETAGAGERLSWAATANTYFTATLAPMNPDGTDGAHYIASVDAVDLDGRQATDDDISLRFVTKSCPVEAGAAVEYPVEIYLGEKNINSFKSVEDYTKRNYYFQISQGFGWCTFAPLVELMIWLLNGLYAMVANFGVAIIILVLIVRALLHGVTKHGQVNMARMQKVMGDLQPKLEEIKKKYANDKARLQEEQMKVYREMGTGPAAGMMGCLPMLIQMPIWIALWMSLSNNILMRHKPFMLWINDLTAPDALYTFSEPLTVPFFGWSIPSFNLLPILLAIAMYAQQKLMPKPTPNPNASDQQRQQQETMQRMMPLMNIMMLLIFYKAPSGLTLYIMCSSAFGTVEQLLIRKHIRKLEESGELVKKKREPKGDGMKRPTVKAPGWLEKLQSMADHAKEAQAGRRKR